MVPSLAFNFSQFVHTLRISTWTSKHGFIFSILFLGLNIVDVLLFPMVEHCTYPPGHSTYTQGPPTKKRGLF